jgi:hypothetical protein
VESNSVKVVITKPFREIWPDWTSLMASVESFGWLASFLDFELGYFNEVEVRVEPGPNPALAKVLPMCPQ